MNTAIRLLEQAAARWPDKIAVEEETGSITYGALLRRAQAKKARDFTLADSIREELRARGIEVADTKEGSSWKRI